MAIEECRTAKSILETEPRAAFELYLQAARTCFIAETVGWRTELDILQGLLSELASHLHIYESGLISSGAANAAISGGKSSTARL
jgi:hypothetical protein